MGEKANVTSEELAASAAVAGGLGGQLGHVVETVRDTVVTRTVDGAFDRRSEQVDPDEQEPEPGKDA